MKTSSTDWWQVVGIIDSYGAIHYRKITLEDDACHEGYWPGKTHKRWRFDIRNWRLDRSVFSGDLTEAEREDIEAKMRKILTPPEWFLENEKRERSCR